MRILDLLERIVEAYERDTSNTETHRAHCRRIDERMAKVREHEATKAGTVAMTAPAHVSYRHEPMQPIPEIEEMGVELGSLQTELAALRDSLRAASAALPNSISEEPK